MDDLQEQVKKWKKETRETPIYCVSLKLETTVEKCRARANKKRTHIVLPSLINMKKKLKVPAPHFITCSDCCVVKGICNTTAPIVAFPTKYYAIPEEQRLIQRYATPDHDTDTELKNLLMSTKHTSGARSGRD